MIIVPSKTKQFFQNNRSDILGNLWATFNADLQSNLGAFRLSPRLRINTSGVANQGLAVAFASFDQKIFSICDTRIFSSSSSNSLLSQFTEDTSTGAITTYSKSNSDMCVFNSAIALIVTADASILSKTVSGGAWTSRGSLTAGALHKVLYFKKFDRVYFLDALSKIYSMDSSFSIASSGNYSIDLGFGSGMPYTMVADDDSIWIGLFNNNAGGSSGDSNGMRQASILRWDGKSSEPNAEYNIKAQGIVAMSKDDSGTIYAVDTNGAILAFNGAGFKEIDRLPVGNSLLNSSTTSTLKYDESFIHPNGFYYTKNGTFILNICNTVGDSTGSIKERLPSGIWEYSKETGLVHKGSASLNSLSNTTITDYAQNRVSKVGALYQPNMYSASASGRSSLICGIDYYSDASTSVSGIFVDDPDDTIQKFGYLVTDWIESPNVKDTWGRAYVKFRQFLSSDDKLIVKYRTTEQEPLYFTGTWTSTTTFTCTPVTQDLSSFSGYEVEVLQGTGAGKCAHITSITGTGTFTITLDETFTGVTSGTFKFRLQAWKKAGYYTGQTSEVEKFSIDKTSRRIQIKICLQFTGKDEFHQLLLSNTENQPVV